MSESLDKLQDIGAQKIYETTHIPVEYVQAILYESFEGLNKIQFIGFISILEREYRLDLSTTRAHGLDYFGEKNLLDQQEKTPQKVYKVPKDKKSFTILYIIATIILLVVAVTYSMRSSNKKENKTIKETKLIKEVKKNIVLDTNNSEKKTLTIKDDINNTQETKKSDNSKKVVAASFKIVPRTKVWLGYIDVATNKKYQKTFSDELDLDPTKEWLLFFGHGFIDLTIDGKTEKFNDRHTLRLLYKDGKITKISLEEFKKLNRGNKW